MSGKPLFRGQGNESFRTAQPVSAAKRGQTVPYDINGAPNPEDILSGAGVAIVREAGASLGGHRAVYIASDGLAYHAGPDATARFTIGVTRGAAAAGDDVSIQCDGVMEEPSWSWIATEVVWLGSSGVLTQTVPIAGTAFQVGVATGPTSLRLEPELIAKLS